VLLALALAVLPGAAAATLPGQQAGLSAQPGAGPDASLSAAMAHDCPAMRAAAMAADPDAGHAASAATALETDDGSAAGPSSCGHDACCPVGAWLAFGALPAAPPASAALAPANGLAAAPALALRHDRPPRTAPIR
jgi:hypothetical protein